MIATCAGPVLLLGLLSAGQTPQVQEAVNSRLVVARKTEDRRQLYEDIEVMRLLLQRTLAETYGLPTHHGGPHPADAAHQPPAVEGVYLPGRGLIFTATGLVGPGDEYVKSAPAAPPALSAWERARLELRGEKLPAAKAPPPNPPLGQKLLSLLAESGQHFAQLAPDERVTFALTFRTTSACTSCHDTKAAPPTRVWKIERGQAVQIADALAASFNEGIARQVILKEQDDRAIADKVKTARLASVEKSAVEAENAVLLGDLHAKQGKLAEAASAYEQALTHYLRAYETAVQADRQIAGADGKALLRGAELAAKLAQVRLAAGDSEAAKKAVLFAAKLTRQAEELTAPTPPTANKMAQPLPSRLILSVPKKALDAAVANKLTPEEFRKAVDVEFIAFPPPEKK